MNYLLGFFVGAGVGFGYSALGDRILSPPIDPVRFDWTQTWAAAVGGGVFGLASTALLGKTSKGKIALGAALSGIGGGDLGMDLYAFLFRELL